MTKLLMMTCVGLALTWQAAYAGTDTTQINPLFYRGTEYSKVFSPSSGGPYLYTELPGQRKVLYYDLWFNNVDLKYDAEDDAVITYDITGGLRVALTKEKVKEFIIGNKRFTRIGNEGYFEVYYDGDHGVFVKWQKVLIRKGIEDPVYKIYRKIYVSDKNALVEVGGTNDLLKITGKTGKKYMDQVRNKGLSFKKDFPMAAAEMMRLADLNATHE